LVRLGPDPPLQVRERRDTVSSIDGTEDRRPFRMFPWVDALGRDVGARRSGGGGGNGSGAIIKGGREGEVARALLHLFLGGFSFGLSVGAEEAVGGEEFIIDDGGNGKGRDDNAKGVVGREEEGIEGKDRQDA
ncbi:MAG: hypothetical protein Q9163_006052, partial [Psora crenata]